MRGHKSIREARGGAVKASWGRWHLGQILKDERISVAHVGLVEGVMEGGEKKNHPNQSAWERIQYVRGLESSMARYVLESPGEIRS